MSIHQYIDEGEKEFEEMFEYTDFAGDIGGFILRVKEDSYDTEETLRYKIKSFLRSRQQGLVEMIVKEIEGMKEEILPIHYSDVEPKLDYELSVHEQTLKIGRNQALDSLKDKLLAKKEE